MALEVLIITTVTITVAVSDSFSSRDVDHKLTK